jgi:hypothetical protein
MDRQPTQLVCTVLISSCEDTPKIVELVGVSLKFRIMFAVAGLMSSLNAYVLIFTHFSDSVPFYWSVSLECHENMHLAGGITYYSLFGVSGCVK